MTEHIEFSWVYDASPHDVFRMVTRLDHLEEKAAYLGHRGHRQRPRDRRVHVPVGRVAEPLAALGRLHRQRRGLPRDADRPTCRLVGADVS